MSDQKNWEVEINGKVHEQKFATEDEANQYAANQRGQDWSMKIDVRGPRQTATTDQKSDSGVLTGAQPVGSTQTLQNKPTETSRK